MAEYLTQQQVCNLAERADILLEESEVAQMTNDLNGILEGLEPLREQGLLGAQESWGLPGAQAE